MKGSVEMLREKGISRKVCAIVCSIVMALSLFATGVNLDTIVAKADGVVTATITYTAQYDGSFKDVKVGADVSSDTAEKYGYNDPVSQSDGVSMLDVLVQIHKDIFPEFSADNRDEYLTVADNGYGLSVDNNIFKKGGDVCGYYKNHVMPSNLEAKVANNDVVEFFYYQDAGYQDKYALFKDVSKTINESTGNEELSGKAVASTWSGESALSGVELGWLNLDTLEIIPINPFSATKTKNDGSFAFEMPNTSSNYLLTVLDGSFSDDNTPIVRTLCVEYPPTPRVATLTKNQEEKLEAYNGAGNYLANLNKPFVYGELYIESFLLGLGRAGYPVDASKYSSYYNSVKEQIAGNNNNNSYKASGMKMASAQSNGYFDSVTECAKVVVALNSIGYDPTNIDGVDITAQLNDAEGVEESFNRVGSYAYAYVLIALDTKQYPSSNREIYVSKLLENQLDNGAWGYNGTKTNIDMTGMVLAALAPYYNSNSSVKEAVDKALDFLSNAQAPSGAFADGSLENSNTTANVLLGLSELGINADIDPRFIKNGVSLVDALCSFAVKGGGFGWTDNTEASEYATSQSYYALCSYFRLINGMNRLFDMTPEKNISSDAKQASAPTTTKVSSVPKTGDKLIRFI